MAAAYSHNARLCQAVNINKSLSALGTVVMALSSGDYSCVHLRSFAWLQRMPK